MFNLDQNEIITGIKLHNLRSAQVKWSLLTRSDFAEIRDEVDLVAKIQQRYSLSLSQAKSEVEIWNRNFKG
jgi:hypothetical protein